MDAYYANALKTAEAAYTNETPTGFKKNKELSDRRSKVYEDTKTGDIYMAFRGTDVQKTNDLIADGFILGGMQGLSPRFRGSADKLKRTQKKFPDKRIITTGHSLGGSQSVWLGKNYNGIHASYGFNAGSNPRYEVIDHVTDKIRGPRYSTQIHEYSTGVDPISLGIHLPGNANNTKTIVEKKEGLDVHTLKNFTE